MKILLWLSVIHAKLLFNLQAEISSNAVEFKLTSSAGATVKFSESVALPDPNDLLSLEVAVFDSPRDAFKKDKLELLLKDQWLKRDELDNLNHVFFRGDFELKHSKPENFNDIFVKFVGFNNKKMTISLFNKSKLALVLIHEAEKTGDQKIELNNFSVVVPAKRISLLPENFKIEPRIITEKSDIELKSTETHKISGTKIALIILNDNLNFSIENFKLKISDNFLLVLMFEKAPAFVLLFQHDVATNDLALSFSDRNPLLHSFKCQKTTDSIAVYRESKNRGIYLKKLDITKQDKFILPGENLPTQYRAEISNQNSKIDFMLQDRFEYKHFFLTKKREKLTLKIEWNSVDVETTADLTEFAVENAKLKFGYIDSNSNKVFNVFLSNSLQLDFFENKQTEFCRFLNQNNEGFNEGFITLTRADLEIRGLFLSLALRIAKTEFLGLQLTKCLYKSEEFLCLYFYDKSRVFFAGKSPENKFVLTRDNFSERINKEIPIENADQISDFSLLNFDFPYAIKLEKIELSQNSLFAIPLFHQNVNLFSHINKAEIYKNSVLFFSDNFYLKISQENKKLKIENSSEFSYINFAGKIDDLEFFALKNDNSCFKLKPIKLENKSILIQKSQDFPFSFLDKNSLIFQSTNQQKVLSQKCLDVPSEKLNFYLKTDELTIKDPIKNRLAKFTLPKTNVEKISSYSFNDQPKRNLVATELPNIKSGFISDDNRNLLVCLFSGQSTPFQQTSLFFDVKNDEISAAIAFKPGGAAVILTQDLFIIEGLFNKPRPIEPIKYIAPVKSREYKKLTLRLYVDSIISDKGEAGGMHLSQSILQTDRFELQFNIAMNTSLEFLLQKQIELKDALFSAVVVEISEEEAAAVVFENSRFFLIEVVQNHAKFVFHENIPNIEENYVYKIFDNFSKDSNMICFKPAEENPSSNSSACTFIRTVTTQTAKDVVVGIYKPKLVDFIKRNPASFFKSPVTFPFWVETPKKII